MPVLILILIAIIIILCIPFIGIWAINTLFALGIAYTIKTYFAMLFFIAVFATKISKKEIKILDKGNGIPYNVPTLTGD